MTFDELMTKTLAVFPNAVLSEDRAGNILIEPGFYDGGGGILEAYHPES